MVSGTLEVAVVPQAGDVIAFHFTEPCNAFVGEREIPFRGLLQVTGRLIDAKAESEITAMLEDVTAATRDDAQRLLEMFEQQYGLMGDIWEDNE
jgi:hypothetical protein